MFIEPLGTVHIRKTVNEVYKRRVNDVHLGRALYHRATIKDVVGEVFGRLENRERWRDASAVKREATVIVHKLIRLRYTGFFEKCLLPFFVSFNKETFPFLLQWDAECSIYLPFKPNSALLIICVNCPYFVIA